MIWSELLTIGFVCAGSIRILGIGIPLVSVPPTLHPLLAAVGACRAEPRSEIFTREADAHKRARELGCGSFRLRSCRSLRCVDVPVTCVTEMTFGEVRP